MRKPISPEQHALIDYGLGTANLAVPSLLGASRGARSLFAAFGAVQGVVTALTDQPLALRRLVPFRVHGRADLATTPMYALLPLAVGAHKDPRTRAFWLAGTAALVALYALTDWDARS